jgi:hypothetical protein
MSRWVIISALALTVVGLWLGVRLSDDLGLNVDSNPRERAQMGATP